MPRGTDVRCRAAFENLAAEELGLLLLALGLAPRHRFDLKLGGGKDRMLGRVCFHLEGPVELRGPAAYQSFSATGEKRRLEAWLDGGNGDPVEVYLRSLGAETRGLVESIVTRFQTGAGATAPAGSPAPAPAGHRGKPGLAGLRAPLRKESLLEAAAELAAALPRGCAGEVRAFQRYYGRHGDLAVAGLPLPHRGGSQEVRWLQVGRALRAQEGPWRAAGYTAEEILFLLGWAARLIGTGGGQPRGASGAS